MAMSRQGRDTRPCQRQMSKSDQVHESGMPARADTKIALLDYLAAHLGGKELISCLQLMSGWR